MLKITSPETLDARVADAVRLKLRRAALATELEAEIAALQKSRAGRIGGLDDAIAEVESEIRDYCVAHRAELFPKLKSRDSLTAVFGFELTPPRVEPASRRVTWKEVVTRLLRLDWGRAYVRTPEPKPDKEALLSDREKLTAEQLVAAGIKFEQDEQFFIRPKAEQAPDTTQAA